MAGQSYCTYGPSCEVHTKAFHLVFTDLSLGSLGQEF